MATIYMLSIEKILVGILVKISRSLRRSPKRPHKSEANKAFIGLLRSNPAAVRGARTPLATNALVRGLVGVFTYTNEIFKIFSRNNR